MILTKIGVFNLFISRLFQQLISFILNTSNFYMNHSLKQHGSVFCLTDFWIIAQSVCYFFTIKHSHCWYICYFGQLIFSEKVFWVLPGWSIADDKDVERKSVLFTFVLKSGVKMCDILAIGTPVDSLLIGFAGEEHDALGFILNKAVEGFLCFGVWDLYHRDFVIWYQWKIFIKS